ncbi:D-alanine--poly(phosphoribitol) ligase, subunit 2 [Clostridium argentinense CDC 2741]|uniref:D-alanyl carrier protein n=1 Tax=Clostridium argentinense CDC 2741 TaxID=1418104 RepID=A0A0C1U3D7_9CLOT|nr:MULTISPECIES: D-alanine--poly(phosphoribitol) ligase subunit DltC [Clostridium]MCU6396836.1 D-alanine--poly(phosphoribitol) ligase subunit DltC [Enterobacter quasiroggenkampii]ARC83508.1 D-alanine--poly(phosphoribitol) ligase subunit 2 [Clostridium argentinense]KIE45973.1 D-alanine--poly(phosphoribitol) ligase, subunit 2 [Clostridium argentinense CDC 2741]NFF39044.1 D-alanine--poly(phosphoribitol) ligase subunit DltC [Clostridium argentinense]NFP49456.1 D-alanine--poly(phosphoribitol) ligas
MENTVLEILEDICGTDEFKEDLDINLFDAGLLDSLGSIEILLELEERLGIKLQPTELERSDIETPNNLIAFLKKKGF